MDKNVQYILEVAKCGGITKAANNLYITPSALSKFVQAREEELNVQLFHRIGKRFVLTAAGEYYVGRCKEIETIQKEITIQMERFSSMSHGMIRIGVQPSFSDLVLKDIIPKFQESFPAVKIILQEYSTGELMELLKKQQVDVVLATIDQKDADLAASLEPTRQATIWNTARLKCVSLSWQSVKIIIWQRWRWRRKDFSIHGLTLKRVKKRKMSCFYRGHRFGSTQMKFMDITI